MHQETNNTTELSTSSFVLHDQHVHSSFSKDSNESYSLYLKEAIRIGCKYFVTTEHVDYDVNGTKNHWLVDYDKLIELKNSLSNDITNNSIELLLGIEIGYRYEYLDSINDMINKYPFDIVNLSIHGNGLLEYYFIDGFIKYGIKETINMYYNQMYDALCRFSNFDVLSHIDYGFKTIYKIDPNYGFFADIDIIKNILLKLISLDKCLEINIKVVNSLPIKHLYDLLSLYKSLGGIKLTLSTDAHKIDRYHEYFDKYINIIKESGFNYLCYFINRIEHHYDIELKKEIL